MGPLPTDPTLSFVIPAFNEAGTIDRTIDSIHSVTSDVRVIEVIVVDNASTDRTAEIATGRKAKVVTEPLGPVGRLRNLGAGLSTGRVLVFLDADVWLEENWGSGISSILRKILVSPRTIIGSFCRPPRNASWIERYWFEPRVERPTHVGSGHMIISRMFFEELGGFDETLETGEDYDICRRAIGAGGAVEVWPQLGAVHEGFPKTIVQFVKRESWHGMSDFKTVETIRRSKVAIATVGFSGLHVALLVFVLLQDFLFATGFFLAIGGLCASFAFAQQRYQSTRHFAIATGVSYFYFLGRSLSLFRAVGSWLSDLMTASSRRYE